MRRDTALCELVSAPPSRQCMSCDVESRDVISCQVMSCHLASCRLASCHHVACHGLSRLEVLSAFSRHVIMYTSRSISLHVMTCRVTSCHVTSRVTSRRASRVTSIYMPYFMSCCVPAKRPSSTAASTTSHCSGKDAAVRKATPRTRTKRCAATRNAVCAHQTLRLPRQVNGRPAATKTRSVSARLLHVLPTSAILQTPSRRCTTCVLHGRSIKWPFP